MEVAGARCSLNDLILVQLCRGTLYIHRFLETSITLLIPYIISLVVDRTLRVSISSIKRKHMSDHISTHGIDVPLYSNTPLQTSSIKLRRLDDVIPVNNKRKDALTGYICKIIS
jgi:hypothetical protein